MTAEHISRNCNKQITRAGAEKPMHGWFVYVGVNADFVCFTTSRRKSHRQTRRRIVRWRLMFFLHIRLSSSSFPLIPPSKMTIATTANKIRMSFLWMMNTSMIAFWERVYLNSSVFDFETKYRAASLIFILYLVFSSHFLTLHFAACRLFVA